MRKRYDNVLKIEKTNEKIMKIKREHFEKLLKDTNEILINNETTWEVKTTSKKELEVIIAIKEMGEV